MGLVVINMRALNVARTIALIGFTIAATPSSGLAGDAASVAEANVTRGEKTADTRISDLPLFARPERSLLAQVEDDTNDPLEPMNRVFFTFNQYVYDLLLTPIAKTYNSTVPDAMRLAVGNLVDHLASPVTFVNDVLQLEFTRAMTTVARFVVNTVAGLGGIADVANDSGLKEHKEDFGQTLGVYGMGEGLYLVLPLMGPSNPRDAVGKYLVDPFFDPLGMYLANTDRDAETYARIGVTALDEYAAFVDELEQIQKTSVDYYAAIRSLYRQRRASQISNGRDEDLPPIPNYDLNFATEGSGAGSIADVK